MKIMKYVPEIKLAWRIKGRMDIFLKVRFKYGLIIQFLL